MDGIKPILEAIKAGVIDASSATIPKMQGSMSILMLWQASLGVPIPQSIACLSGRCRLKVPF
jgi:ribose transport system substrate-binding protein